MKRLGMFRFFVPLAAMIFTASCGFEPLHRHAAASASSSALATISVAPIAERSGQILRNYLLDRLTPRGAPTSPSYRLEIRLDEPRQTLALRRDDVISRVNYTATAFYRLTDASNRTVLSHSTSFSTDYEVTNSEFATLMSSQAARDRVLEIIADDIRNALVAHFRTP